MLSEAIKEDEKNTKLRDKAHQQVLYNSILFVFHFK